MSQSPTGVWIDQATNLVVEAEPVEGVLLVAPGGEITPDVEAAIERARVASAPVETADEPADIETGADEAQVETADEPAVEAPAPRSSTRGKARR